MEALEVGPGLLMVLVEQWIIAEAGGNGVVYNETEIEIMIVLLVQLVV